MAITTWRKELTNDYGDISSTFESAIIGEPVYEDNGFRPIRFNSVLIEEWTDPRFQKFLDTEFDAGFGGTEGIPFRIYTKEAIYFSHAYDGAESVQRIHRDPSQYIGKSIHTIE